MAIKDTIKKAVQQWPIKEKRIEVQKLTVEEQDDVKFLEDFFAKGLEIRRPHEIYWYRNMAYFLGYQYIVYDPIRGTLRVPPAPPWRVRTVDNHIQPNALYTVSKLSKNDAVYIPVPNKEDDNSQYSCRISKKILKHIQQSNHYKQNDWELKLMAYVYGMAYRDLMWDFEMGDPIIVMPDQNGNDQFINTGDVSTIIRSPFDVVWEEGAKGVKDSLRIGTMTVRDLEYIRKAYPKTGIYVEPENVSGSSSIEKLLLSLMKKTFMSGEQVSTKDLSDTKHEFQQGKAVIKQIREKPTAQFPKGRLITYANHVLLDRGELPYEFMWKKKVFGIKKYDFIKLNERWAGESPVNIQIPIQDRINKLQSSILEILNEMAKPKWLVPTSANLPQNSIDNETGEILEYNAVPGVPPPGPVQGKGPDNAFYADLEQSKRSIENAAMLHDTSKGLKVKGVDSKILAEFLQEQDLTVYGPVSMRFEEQDSEYYTWALMLFKEKAIEPRKLQILGENNEVEMFDFNNEEDFPTALVVIPGSSAPSSLIVQNKRVLDWFQAGLFGDPTNPESNINDSIRMRIMTMTELGDVEELFKKMRLDLREARREHQKWEKGIVEPPNMYDNHVIMEQEHTMWKKSDIYRNIKLTNPALAMQIEEHCTIHIELHPQYQQQQKMQDDEARLRSMEDNKMALEMLEKRATIKEKALEGKLAILAAQGNTNVSKQQTVKG